MAAQVCGCPFTQIHCQLLSTGFVLSKLIDPHARYGKMSTLVSGRSFIRFYGVYGVVVYLSSQTFVPCHGSVVLDAALFYEFGLVFVKCRKEKEKQ